MSQLENHFKYCPYKSRKILLVDNERDLGWTMKKIMCDAGHKLIYASSFKEGVQKFKRLKNLDIAIIDLKLEDGDGLNFVRKARKVNGEVKFVMASAFGSPEVKVEAKQLGVCYFLDKPLEIEELLNIINWDLYNAREFGND